MSCFKKFIHYILFFFVCHFFAVAQDIDIKEISDAEISIYAPYYNSASNVLYYTQRVSAESGDTVDILKYTKLNISDNKTKFEDKEVHLFNNPVQFSSIGTCSFSFDEKVMLISATRMSEVDTTWFLVMAQRKGENYYFKDFLDSSKRWIGHPTLSLDGKKIVFSMINNRKHGADLHCINLSEYYERVNTESLSEVINSDFDEVSPFLTMKGNRLLMYYASNRPGGKGGYDLYKTSYDSDNNVWEKPAPLDQINSEMHDIFASTPHSLEATEVLFFASNRNDNHWHIYSAFPNPAPPEYVIVSGIVYDATDANDIHPIPHTEVIFRNQISKLKIESVQTNSIGNYTAVMPLDMNLFVEAYAGGMAHTDTLVFYSSKTLTEMEEVKLDFFLKDTFDILRDTVFFDYNSAELKVNDKVNLIIERLVDYLNMSSSNRVKILGHSCKISQNKKRNKLLSIQRAKTIVDILVTRGINSEKLSYQGMADTQPLPEYKDCNSEQDCAPNRRVEIIYLK